MTGTERTGTSGGSDKTFDVEVNEAAPSVAGSNSVGKALGDDSSPNPDEVLLSSSTRGDDDDDDDDGIVADAEFKSSADDGPVEADDSVDLSFEFSLVILSLG